MTILASTTTDKIIVDRTKKSTASAKAVHEVRTRLNSDYSAPIAFEKEMLTSYAQNILGSAKFKPLIALLVSVVSYFWVGVAQAGCWYIILLLASLVQTNQAKNFIAADVHQEEELPKWRDKFAWSTLVISLVWSLLALFAVFASLDKTYAIFLFASVLLYQAINMMLANGLGVRFMASTLPPTLAVSAVFTYSLEPAMLFMATTLLVSQSFFFFLAERFKLQVISILEHKAERETLIGELETARAMSDEARRRAEEANLAKSRFLATMSHELRTPLNAILGFSEVMRDEVLGPIDNNSYKDYIKDIHSSGQHLLNLINEILDLSRIEAGRHDLREEAVKLPHIVEEAKNMLQIKAKSKGVQLVLQLQPELPQIWADERGVRQIVLNLLSNALKFTPTGGSVTIKVGWTRSGGQYVSIKDTGPGIPEEEIPIVLSSFGQGSIAIKSAEQGTGLGLPIVQALVHMHDGKFELKSKLREGTEVIATFPRSRILEVMPPVKNAPNVQQKPRNMVSNLKKSGKPGEQQPARPANNAQQQLRSGQAIPKNTGSIVKATRATLGQTG